MLPLAAAVDPCGGYAPRSVRSLPPSVLSQTVDRIDRIRDLSEPAPVHPSVERREYREGRG